MLIAFTGMAFNWKTQTQSVLEFVTFNKVEQRPEAPKVITPSQAALNYNEAIKNAENVFPDGKLYRIYLPKKDDEAIALRMQNLAKATLTAGFGLTHLLVKY
ncbi:hypothetical protein P4S63_23325 [Pseudoalteromonas sp. B193]